MSPDQESKHGTEQPERPAASSPPRPPRRSSRGRRGRGHRPRPPRADSPGPPERGPVVADQAIEPPVQPVEVEPAVEPAPVASEPLPVPSRQFQPAEPASVQKAIEEVNHILGLLKEAVDDMEEVLETLELAERQKNADEQEIESLLRALRQFQRPRDR